MFRCFYVVLYWGENGGLFFVFIGYCGFMVIMFLFISGICFIRLVLFCELFVWCFDVRVIGILVCLSFK